MAKANTRRSGGRTSKKSAVAIRVESGKGSTRAEARRVTADGRSVKRRVSKLSVDTFHENDLSLDDMPRVVHDVLSGAVDAVDRNIPQSRNNVLREVFDGLSEGFNRVNRAAGVMMGSEGNGRRTTSGRRSSSNSRGSHASDDFLGAVSSFASRASKRVRDELNSFVDSAERRTGGRAHATEEASRRRRNGDDGMMETAGSAVRAGMRSARRAAEDVAEMAGGMVDGMMGRTGSSARESGTRRKSPQTVGRAVARTVRKATGARKSPKRRGR